MKLKARPLGVKGSTQKEINERSHGVTTVENCHIQGRFAGKPLNWKKKSDGEGHAFQTTIEETKDPQSTSKAALFTMQQLEHLHKLFYLKMSVNPSCSLAQKGTYLTVVLFSSNRSFEIPWVIDSGATDHMIDCLRLFFSYADGPSLQ